ncbi:MAG TPA: putative toxin-antitoxin system toxin component, PIN family [Thermoanaerobaculia bacterium]|nr:putative toxin-antitoxin system toxin component, PIN family [Thermoanaerobaculia bacterium]
MRVVLDTSVLVAAIRSRRGASFQLLTRLGSDDFDVAVSVPLVLEYEDALMRHLSSTTLDESDIAAILDYMCSVADHQEIFFLWRPILRDPGDDMLLEVAVAADCQAIVTHNVRDFAGAEKFGLRVLTPSAFLQEIQ